MTAEIIAQVLDAGGHIAVDGTDLVVTAPRPLPDDLLAQIREHKRSTILDALASPDPLSPAAERRRRKVLPWRATKSSTPSWSMTRALIRS